MARTIAIVELRHELYGNAPLTVEQRADLDSEIRNAVDAFCQRRGTPLVSHVLVNIISERTE